MGGRDVVIIGAGVAGLTAAVNLAGRGARVLVLEAKAVLGGRATTFADPQTGDRVDNGQHVLLGCYRETFKLLETLGTAGHVRLQTNLEAAFVDRTGQRSRFACASLPAPLNLLAGIFDWEALGWRDRIAALRMSGPIRLAQRQARGETGDLAASPGETVEGWLIRNGQTTRIREMLWEPLALAALNQSIRQAAAPPFARVLAEMFAGGPRDAALGLPLCPLDELYAEPARAFVTARGGEVRTLAPARIVLEGGRPACVECRGERIQAGAVVCAVPWFALPEVFVGSTEPVERLLQAAAATAPCPIVSVNVWLDRRVLSGPFLGLPGRTLQWVFDKSQVFAAGSSHLTMIASGADWVMARSNDELVEIALREFREALPDARAARVLRTGVVRERRATFSLAPGQPPRPACRTAVDGVFLAGDWIDTGLPATIESAAVSGQRAADAIS